jgi:transposase
VSRRVATGSRPAANAKVEVAVQIAERWIVARLRNQQFFSLSELNTAIHALLDHLNDRVTRHLGASRREIFDQIERAALKPLPAEAYVFSEWKQCTVGLDYHVEVGKHYYSAPHNLLREKVWVRLTARTVEIFHQGQRVAAHVRTSGNRQHTTIPDHMPASHRRHSEWSPERLKAWAAKIGPNTATLIEVILRDRSHPEQGFRSCLGIMRLAKPHGPEALEAACERALTIGARSYSSVHSILKNNLHRAKPEPAVDGPAIQHGNIRGPGYFH